jgi:hypothetical protein
LVVRSAHGLRRVLYAVRSNLFVSFERAYWLGVGVWPHNWGCETVFGRAGCGTSL